MLIYTVILLAVSLGGALWFFECWRGKPIDKHPLCRRCRYDLIGSPEPRVSCPECGADLSAGKTLVIGNRKRQTGPAIFGGLMSLTSTALLLTLLFNPASRTNFNPYKPFWLLHLEATTPALVSHGRELDELLTRTKNGSLSASQLDSLMGSVLQAQADTSTHWDETWGDTFAELFTQGIGIQAQHEQFAKNVYVFELNVRPRVRLGDTIDIDINRSYNRGQGNSAKYYFAERGERIEINGFVSDRTKASSSGGGYAADGGSVGSGTSLRTNQPPFDQIPIGKHTLTFTQPTEIRLGSSGPLIATIDRTASAQFELIPADANDIEMFTDPLAAAAMEAGISIEGNRIELRPQRNNPERFNAHITVKLNGTTAPFGYQIIARSNGHEWDLVALARNMPANNTSHGFGISWPADLTADHVDLIFRPDPDAARKIVNVYRILDHEFVIEDVEVVRQP